MSIPTTLRNATLDDLVPMLQAQQDVKVDAVVPATKIRSVGGILHVDGLRVFGPALLRPTEIMDTQIATRLGIPPSYLKALRNGKAGKDGSMPRIDLYDANVNGWLHGGEAHIVHPQAPEHLNTVRFPPDGRKFLVRSFLPDEGEGIGRALFSDRFAIMDNLDALMAALAGINESGVECSVVKCDLSERRMSVRFAAPGITALAPTLLEGYRPQVGGWGADAFERHSGYKPGEQPIVFAGFEVNNGETGGSALDITPVITVQICRNGLKRELGKVRRVHLGARLEEGQVNWSAETTQRQVALVKSMTTDAVKAFLDPAFLAAAVEEIELKAGKPIEDVTATVELVAKKLAFTETEQAGILSHFIKGGQMTAGGLLNSITSYAQTVADPDKAYDLEEAAMQAFDMVAA